MSAIAYREINGIVDKKNGTKICISSTDSDNYEDYELDLDCVERAFNPYRGDRIRMFIAMTVPSKVIRIEPWKPLREHIGTITYLTKCVGIVDNDIVFFIADDNNHGIKLNEKVRCSLIDGDYSIRRSIKFKVRCESIKKFDDNLKIVNKRFHYALQDDLYSILSSGKMCKIEKNLNECLDKFIPAKLNYETYKKYFHALIDLEEVEMKMSFEKYRTRETRIKPNNKHFSIMYSKIAELRPPITAGELKSLHVCMLRLIGLIDFLFFPKRRSN